MTQTNSPRLSEVEVVTQARELMQSLSKKYDLNYGLQPQWKGLNQEVPGSEGQTIALWSVAFLTPPGPFDQVLQFIELDDTTGRPLHILTGTGRLILQ